MIPGDIAAIVIQNIGISSKLNFLPIPVDENIENLCAYENKYKNKDLFFAFSHGVNFGKLKKGKYDEREAFIDNLIKNFQTNF